MLAALLLGTGILLFSAAAAEGEGTEVSRAQLDEIIVTATRREESLASVPLSVSVVSEDALRALGATAFADYARTVPGLSFTDGGSGGEKQTIRGISINPWSEASSATAVHLDEVPLTNAGGGVGPPFNPDPVLIDINRIEVLRGPQGTLFGAGAMGGAIRIVTNTPNLDGASTEIETTATSTKHGEIGYGVHGIFNTPVSESAALRTVVYQRDLGGFIDNVLEGRNDANNREITGVRLTGLFQTSDRASVTTRIAWQNRESDGFSTVDPNIGDLQHSRSGELIADEWLNLNVVVDMDYDWGRFRSSTSYLDRDVDVVADISLFMNTVLGLPLTLNVVNDEAVGEFVQEFRLVSDGDGRFGWLAGVFYQDQEQDTSQDFPAPGFDDLTGDLASMFGPPDNLAINRATSSLNQIAVYGEVSYELTPRVELTAGGRWYDIDRDYSANNQGFLVPMGAFSESQSAGDTGTIPRVSLNFAMSDDWSVYASVAEGFRPGGINPGGMLATPPCVVELDALGFDSAPVSYESDSLVSYEVGTRYRSPEGRLRMSAAAFSIDWSDIQTLKFLRCGAGFIENAGAAESKGLEVELEAAPLDSLELVFAASLNNAELSEDVPNLNGMRGDRVPGAPRITARGGARIVFPAFGGRDGFAQADLQYVGTTYMEFDGTPEVPSYTIANLRFGVDAESWSAVLFIDNAANEDGALFINDNPVGKWLTPIRPRTVGVSLNWRF